MLGGLTLASAYALGADSVNAAFAPAALTAIGIVQLAVGAVWITNARRLQTLAADHPGTGVAITLIAATTVAALGGSGAESAWVTSAQCWLVAAGALLPIAGVVVAATITTLVAATTWILLDGSTGGYRDDGGYAIAVIALAKFLAVGLVLGWLTGRAWQMLRRWHVIEAHERGVVRHLRERVAAVDTAAARLAEQLAGTSATAGAEIAALRARLANGIAPPDGASTAPLRQLINDLAARLDLGAVDLHIELADDTADILLDPLTADALAAAIERQTANTVRHAPNATHIALHATKSDTGTLRVRITDDGGGNAPVRIGTGTAWSHRQLRRVGGRLDYFDATTGTGLALEVPVAAKVARALPVRDELARFAIGMISVLRWSSYVGDSLSAYGTTGIDGRWLLMPIGALGIEVVLQRGIPGRRLSADQRLILASLMTVALTLAFTLPAGSPDALIPASTSVVVLAQLLLLRQHLPWLVFELARALAVLPLVLRAGSDAVGLVVIYPLAFNALIYAFRRFVDRAGALEQATLDAFGRASLAAATVRGLALHHDAVDVLLRSAPDDAARDAAIDLEDAVRALDSDANATQDPREVVRSGVAASLSVPIHLDTSPANELGRAPVAAIDRITLVELAALAADERASCIPPGLLGRRRLQAMHLRWDDRPDGTTEITLTAIPTVRPPSPRTQHALERVAATLGLTVHSTATSLRIDDPAPS